MHDTTRTKEFYPIWKKYKPVLLKMMMDALEGDKQEYQLSKHEFTDVNSRKGTSCSFELQIYKGRNLKLLKQAVIVSDLIEMLRQSAKANELMDEAIYTISMDTQFNLLLSAESVAVD